MIFKKENFATPTVNEYLVKGKGLMRSGILANFFYILLVLAPIIAVADEELLELSLEDLMNETVISVSNKEASLKDTPAAVYVITADDIKKSGFKSIPETLRLVPGMHIAQISANTWAISSRGFATRYADKMQVLLNGQSVYSTLFSGVHWDSLNPILEDIERIEVIRGPGATLWGANAVNGVINIITKKAQDTQGGYLEMGAGSNDMVFGALRYGSKFNEDIFYSLYTKGHNYGATDSHNGDERADDWHLMQGGARIDWNISAFTDLTLQADYMASDDIGSDWINFNDAPDPTPGGLAFPNSVIEEDQYVSNANLLFKLNHEFSASHRMSVQVDMIEGERRTPIGDEQTSSYNFDLKHFYRLDNRRQFTWGLGYKAVHEEVESSPTFTLDPEHDTFETYSGFVEYSTQLQPDKLTLILGSKFEDNSYTGFEFQPNARLSYKISEKSVVWTAYSRAVRTPARFENHVTIQTAQLLSPLTLPLHNTIQVKGNTNIESEILDAYEIGFRTQLVPEVTIDIAAFYNDYSNFNIFETDESTILDPNTPIVQNINNNGTAESYGVETAIKWQATDDWRLSTTYSFFELDINGPSDSNEEATPSHMLNLHSSYNISSMLSFHLHSYYQDSIAETGIEQFTRVDAGLIWKIKPNMEFSIWGQNLLDPRHEENEDMFFSGEVAQIPRSVYAQLSMTF
jgi:iron complex outermembrane recepter protein